MQTSKFTTIPALVGAGGTFRWRGLDALCIRGARRCLSLHA